MHGPQPLWSSQVAELSYWQTVKIRREQYRPKRCSRGSRRGRQLRAGKILAAKPERWTICRRHPYLLSLPHLQWSYRHQRLRAGCDVPSWTSSARSACRCRSLARHSCLAQVDLSCPPIGAPELEIAFVILHFSPQSLDQKTQRYIDAPFDEPWRDIQMLLNSVHPRSRQIYL